MLSYSIRVIDPDADLPVAENGAQLIVNVDNSTAEPRVVQIAITSSASAGLSPEDLMAVDIQPLISALATQGRQAAAASQPATPKRAAGKTAMKIDPLPNIANLSERKYRRMPPKDEVLAVFKQVGTVTAMARHYDVPRHTAQGWMGRIRNTVD